MHSCCTIAVHLATFYLFFFSDISGKMLAIRNYVFAVMFFVGLQTRGKSQNEYQWYVQLTKESSGNPCPLEKQCTCYSGNTHVRSIRVDCSKRNLTAVPKHLPNNTNNIDLSNNQIKQLGQLPFVNYPVLQVLDLSLNEIEFIGTLSFGE